MVGGNFLEHLGPGGKSDASFEFTVLKHITP